MGTLLDRPDLLTITGKGQEPVTHGKIEIFLDENGRFLNVFLCSRCLYI